MCAGGGRSEGFEECHSAAGEASAATERLLRFDFSVTLNIIFAHFRTEKKKSFPMRLPAIFMRDIVK